MRRLIKILCFIILFLVLDTVVLWLVKPEAFSSPQAMRRAGAEIIAPLLARVMEARLKLPEQVDDTTRLDGISAEGSKIIYNLTLTNATNENFNNTAGEVRNYVTKSACGREDYLKLLSYGLTIVLSLHSREGIEAPPITITPEICGLDK